MHAAHLHLWLRVMAPNEGRARGGIRIEMGHRGAYIDVSIRASY